MVNGSDIVQKAAAEAGWVAALLVFLVMGGFLSFGWVLRQLWLDQRASREFQQTTLIVLQERSNEVMNRTNATLSRVVLVLERIAFEEDSKKRRE